MCGPHRGRWLSGPTDRPLAARSVNMRDLTIPMQIATLHDNGTLAAIPEAANPLVVEIGVSDRNTLDTELLPKLPVTAFLVSCEPLVDKYSRGLARHKSTGDLFQPLGMHHARGLILPLAIGPVSLAEGEARTFNIPINSGCASLDEATRPLKGRHTYGYQCGRPRERMEVRRVWVVPLSTLLDWIGARPIALVKVVAQGLQLRLLP